MDASLKARAEQLAQDLATQASTAEDVNDLMRLMMKSALERMLNTEMDVHLGRRSASAEQGAVPESSTPPTGKKKRAPNRRNGRSRKTVQGDMGELTLSTP